jgi:hypothetical protein
MEFETIHTINARDNVFMEVMSELSPSKEVFQEDFFSRKQELSHMLIREGVNYSDLKSALVPSRHKKEVSFIFDWETVEQSDACYGHAIFDSMLPLFGNDWTCSVMIGDISPSKRVKAWMIKNGEIHVPDAKINPMTLFAVFINNISENRIAEIHDFLRSFRGYIGFCDITSPSYMRDVIACTVTHMFVKCKDVMLSSSPDVMKNLERGTMFYEYEKHGFRSLLVPEEYFIFLLSYKIEGSMKWEHKFDDAIATNLMGMKKNNFQDIEVLLSQPKLGYLHKEKAESLSLAGLDCMDSIQIAEQIKTKLENHYVYNIARSLDGSIGKCCVNIRLNNRSFFCALKCDIGIGKLEVTTFY